MNRDFPEVNKIRFLNWIIIDCQNCKSITESIFNYQFRF